MSVGRSERNLPIITTVLMACVRPATAARRTNHVSLGRAYATHWAALLLVASEILLLIEYIPRVDPPGEARVGTLTTAAGKLVYDLGREPLLWTTLAIGSVVGGELGFLALAILVTPWGARDEPIRASIVHAIRRTWLQTPHLVLAVLVFGGLVLGMKYAVRSWILANPRPDPPLSRPPKCPAATVPVHSRAWRDYNAALHAHRAAWEPFWPEWEAYHAAVPWYYRYPPRAAIVRNGFFLALAWFVWGLCRSVGADRTTPVVQRAPLCQVCGYTLTGMPVDGRCPECGEPVRRSEGPDVRPGAPWQHRRRLGRLRAWWRCTADANFRPERFGRQIASSADPVHHRRFLLCHILVLFVLGTVGMAVWPSIGVGGYVSMKDVLSLVWGAEPDWLSASAAGYLVALGGVAGALAAAWCAALRHRSAAHGRNLLGLAMQTASYLTGCLVFWVAASALWGALVLMLPWLLKTVWQSPLSIPIIYSRVLPKNSLLLTWLSVHLFFGVRYLLLVVRGTAGARFANR